MRVQQVELQQSLVSAKNEAGLTIKQLRVEVQSENKASKQRTKKLDEQLGFETAAKNDIVMALKKWPTRNAEREKLSAKLSEEKLKLEFGARKDVEKETQKFSRQKLEKEHRTC
jgi:phosphotransferase system IIB component